ncbi:MAG: M48 family metallopeptidase [Marinilabiliaceae bacterium]|nr:M48 family metallopeptidase [Marinilabiliaceae bacterium]
MEQEIKIEGIGTVTIRQSARAKRINIQLKPFKGVILTIPAGSNPKAGLEFVQQKKEWIKQNLQKIEQKEDRLTIFDETTEFKSRSFALKIEKQDRSNVHMQLNNGLLKVSYPAKQAVEHPHIQEAIRYAIEEALRIEARSFLPGRLAWLAKQWNIGFNNVVIKNLKSRWGSCSAVNNINLNLHLMRLPDPLIDYVLLHELCHVHEKNHGPGFWRRLDKMTDGYARELDGAMRDYQTKIY